MKKTLTIFLKTFFLFLLSVNTANSQSQLDSGLVAYFPFTGNAGDSSVNNNNPIFNNATLTADRFGNPNNAYYFNGTSNYMRIANNPTINFNKTMSLCVWMKPMGYYKGLCYNNIIVAKAITDNAGSNAGNYSLRFADYVNGCNSLADTTKEYLFGPTGGVCLNKNIQTNRWYFVVFTTDGITTRTYINNKLSHTGAFPTSITNFTNQYDLFLGRFGDSVTFPYYFKGVLDDIRIYNRSLTSSEVNELYSNTPYPSINGNVYVDVNNNGIMDSTDYFKPNVKINASNGSFAITDLNGKYDLQADSIGTFATTVNAPYLYTASPNSYSYNFNSYDTSVFSTYTLQNSAAPLDSLTFDITPLFNAARPGFSYPVSVTYINSGNTVLNSSFTLPYNHSQLQYVSSTNVNLIDNGTELIVLPKDLAPGEHTSFMINFNVITTATLGDTLKLVGTTSANSALIQDSSITIIRGSYDPNDKEATPELTTQEVAQGKYITYTIRFENTGTDTAFKVVVVDNLNSFINAGSIQIVKLSHPCSVQVNDNKVTFTFKNINLPDKQTDFIGAHGFVTFMVKPISTISAGTIIPNNASIYFDYNLPIVTNTANTIIKNPVITPVVIKNYQVSLTRNINSIQADNYWTVSSEINCNHYTIQKSYDGILFNNIGTIKANKNSEYKYSNILSVDDLNKPILYYRLQIVDNDGKINYSEIKKVYINPLKNSSITIFPNPADKEIIVARNNDKPDNLYIINISGKIVKTFKLISSQQIIDVSDLASGMYLLKSSNSHIYKLIKQ